MSRDYGHDDPMAHGASPASKNAGRCKDIKSSAWPRGPDTRRRCLLVLPLV